MRNYPEKADRIFCSGVEVVKKKEKEITVTDVRVGSQALPLRGG